MANSFLNVEILWLLINLSNFSHDFSLHMIAIDTINIIIINNNNNSLVYHLLTVRLRKLICSSYGWRKALLLKFPKQTSSIIK